MRLHRNALPSGPTARANPSSRPFRRAVCAIGLLAVALVAALCGLAIARSDPEVVLSRLSFARHLQQHEQDSKSVVYVLGGTPDSLVAKFNTAAELIQKGIASHVLVLDGKSLMEYDATLGRNLTANEWAANRLEGAGVSRNKIEFATIEHGAFGTWSEAKGISRYVGERGYRRLILVTSPYHSRRAWESFSKMLGNPDAKLYLYHSRESAGFGDLVIEYVKLSFYRSFLF